jgi:hypothetical protein
MNPLSITSPSPIPPAPSWAPRVAELETEPAVWAAGLSPAQPLPFSGSGCSTSKACW